MTTLESASTINFSPEQTSAAIEAETRRLITSSAERNNVQVDSFTLAQVEDARRTATETVNRDQALRSNPLFSQLEASHKRNAELEAQIAAVRAGQQARSQPDAFSRESSGRVTDADRAHARLGNEWFLMSQSQKFAAIGIDPQSVTPEVKEHARRIFGRGSSTADAVDLAKSSPARYKQLKEIAQVTGVYGA